MSESIEKQKLEKRLAKQFVKAMATYSLIKDGDKILVGLSGGKDSLCLLELLAKRQRIQCPAFTVEAIHVRMDNIEYESDSSYLQSFAEALGVRLHIVSTSFDTTIKTRKPICFLCSWHRRKAIFNFAQEHGFNKIALGHHMNDIINTTLMNQMFQGSFSTMPVKIKMRKMPLTIIRPLCLIEESEIKMHAEHREYKEQIKKCPFEESSKRKDINDLFAYIERINPEARYSIWNALETENKLIEM
ncbi:MAG: tRNA 2-thiocytidine biosynthesis protein TtcA [Prevotella sp.]|nr:tRNA 2-thiocytidine biosynthesis protein TtcA [Prevotella sp.]